jgi:hypothetical protein
VQHRVLHRVRFRRVVCCRERAGGEVRGVGTWRV